MDQSKLIASLTFDRKKLNTNTFTGEWSELAEAYNGYLSSGNYLPVAQAVLKVFSGKAQVPLLYAIGQYAYKLSIKDQSVAEETARTLNRLFTACITEKAAKPDKKWGAYRLAGLLLRCYFHAVHQVNLVGNVVRALQACELPPIEKYPRGDGLTFKYYLGRYYLGKEALLEALECFEWCWQRLDEGDLNYSKIMAYLVPLKLVIQAKWPKNERNALLKAAWSGDLAKYHQLLLANRSNLLRWGTWNLYSKARLLCLRQLLKHFSQLLESTRIPLRLLRALGAEDALIVQLINCGLVRGYLSEEHGFLVLSSQNAFPVGVGLINNS